MTARQPLMTIEDVVYVRYAAPDLGLMQRFMHDFGLHRVAGDADTLYLGAAGNSQVLHITHRRPVSASLGFGLRASSMADLERLAARTGRAVEDNREPGGGHVVRLSDPGGLQIDVVFGSPTIATQSGSIGAAGGTRVRHAFTRNDAQRRERRGELLRQPRGPSSIMRLGHVVLLVPDFAASFGFYAELFGMRISDTYHAGDPAQPIFAFLHCGLGERWTDHHTVAIGTPPGGIGHSRFDHIAFEVLDLDDLMAGHAHLSARGWTQVWGVGRHVEGSQIFDYWRDPFGHKVEHWTDGDLVNERHQPSSKPMSPDNLAQWGPPLNPDFFV